ncbi:hypothetical protein [Candidatus Enterococcus ferrettii]|uniref:Uncharacterized protein n=1 Tax=Candidatus Enterococcus ferrettii TaxID=2815324 RepID=A0ABV0EI82_9ENTE|nr:hypothetical protein [Enterococcus sp. 665A]MBO1341866.1 hypothetical protein [Enterococcus sp. 665A]
MNKVDLYRVGHVSSAIRFLTKKEVAVQDKLVSMRLEDLENTLQDWLNENGWDIADFGDDILLIPPEAMKQCSILYR